MYVFDNFEFLRIGFQGIGLKEAKFCDFGDLEGGFGCLRRGCCSHVLWYGGMGPLAYCCPNSLLSMLILSLPRTRSILDISCRDSSVSDEPCVFL